MITDVYCSEGYSVMWPPPVISVAIKIPWFPPMNHASSFEDGSEMCARPDVYTTSFQTVSRARDQCRQVTNLRSGIVMSATTESGRNDGV